MNIKRLVMYVSLMVLIMSFASADSCWVTDVASCTGNNSIVFRMSATTNAHAELWNQTNYNYALCCDFSGTHECDGNKVIGISATTNAHAEIPSLSNYGIEVCYGVLLCQGLSACNSSYPIETASLSATTNAHVGGFSNYTTKICCRHNEYCGDGIIQTPNGNGVNESCDDGVNNGELGYCYTDCSGEMGDSVINSPWEECDDGNVVSGDGCSSTGQLEEEFFWADEDGNEIGNDVNGSTIEAYVGQTIKLIWNNTGASPPDTTFDIYEADPLFDDEIRTGASAISGTYSSEGNGIVTGTWTITQEDYEKTEEGDTDNFYFVINTEESGELTILPEDYTEWCMNYDTEEGCSSCSYSGCNAAKNSVDIKVFEAYPEQWGDTRCGDTIEVGGSNCSFVVNCFCEWDDVGGSCGYQWDMIPYNCEEGFPGLGTCTYEEDTTDTCDDGFLEYSWDGIWEWASDNGYADYNDGPSSDVNDYIFEGGLYYYDPTGISEKCVDGSNTIACPAQIQLPFFGFYNFVASLLAISLIYVLLIKKRKLGWER